MKNITSNIRFILVSFLLMLILLPAASSFSADLSSVWDVTMHNKIIIPQQATDKDKTYGVCYLYTDGTFELDENDWGTPRTYSGTYSIANSGKKQKLFLTLDSDGVNELNDMLLDWIYEIASDDGVYVSGLSIQFTKIKIATAIISKKTGIPAKTTLKVKGILTGYKNGKFIRTNITYKSTIKFF